MGVRVGLRWRGREWVVVRGQLLEGESGVVMWLLCVELVVG